jgi:hypothetical protein
MTEENKTRVYGMADQANRHPPAAQGMRGENSSAPAESESEFSHTVTLESGRTVAVSEGNGVAYAEASGRIQVAKVRQEPEELEIEFVPEAPLDRHGSRTPLLIGALIAGAGAGLYLADRWLRSRTERTPEHDTKVRFGDLADERESRALVPVQELPHRQQPVSVEAEISPSASRT